MSTERKSRWIPWVFVGGMGVVVAVNAVLITSAVGTFTGVTTGRAYDRGRAYNHVIEEGRRQDALGWTARVARSGGDVAVTVTDAAGIPVSGLLEAELLRPLDGERVALGAAAARGRFALALPEALRAGQWELRGRVSTGDGRHLDIRHRLVLP
ncbi:FixH family protein [Sabulicella glaciei]|uniref:FixH family protein n=1 Tax=Sabulicella glaciei TaxID=2984948 RepID=A0ABT3NVB8_9PROT|nr:FixH family protein [Roseococcus sp. MDT2-1-1]MCW8086112.1 FixH family protein [Roseococcus sp. MDT2-1-1]